MWTGVAWLPEAASAHAADLDGVLAAIHWHILILAVAWSALFVYTLVRFRAGRQPRPQAHGVRGLLPVLAIGAVIVGDVGVLATSALPAWYRRISEPTADPARPPLVVKVVAEQFAWNIHYTGPDGRFGRTSARLISAANPLGIDRDDPDARDDIGLLNVLTLPLGRTVIIELTSRDVVHSFTLNEMRVKQDAIPGTTTRTWFTPVRTGDWDIACSQLCGLGHYRMRGDYSVVTPDAWDAWEQEELSFIAPVDAPR
ncbi:MAG: cytochrome c oxidase subunit II [Vicinamibacterales bacterium]